MEQPFQPGQRVIALRNAASASGSTILVKGNIYTVEDMLLCADCKEWHVMLAEFRKGYGYSTCCNCWKKLQNVATHALVTHEWFAPLPPAYENISHELAKDAVPETSDVITIKQPILS
jgi:hypothetical protein